MAYDVRYDAPGALALGGVGALGGLAYSYLNKKQRKNKLRNALIGAAALPATWIGGKYIAGKILDATNGPDSSDVLNAYDPLSYINEYAVAPIYESTVPSSDKLSELNEKKEQAGKALQDVYDTAYAEYKPGVSTCNGYTVMDADRYAYQVANNSQESKDYFKAYLDYSNEYDDEKYDQALNKVAPIYYGTLGAGIGLPALYLAYLKKKKKPLQEQLV